MGPTAAGKTELAVRLVQHFPCEIISVDSALVYRGMDIGTAKPEPAVRALAPHHLIDICDPTESYSAAQFRADALRLMEEIRARNRVPLLVGGTMLYFRALQQGLSPLPAADPAVRAALDAEARILGWPALHRRLAAVDPQAAARIHPQDPQRIQRALEVWMLSGQPLSRLQQEQPGNSLPHRLLKLVRAPAERAVLHERIAQRFQAMLDAGFEEEVRRLWARGDLHESLPALRAVGYRQLLQYILGRSSYAAMREKAIIATRQLAKRQYTWLRREPDCHWLLDGEAPWQQAQALVERFLA